MYIYIFLLLVTNATTPRVYTVFVGTARSKEFCVQRCAAAEAEAEAARTHRISYNIKEKSLKQYTYAGERGKQKEKYDLSSVLLLLAPTVWKRFF